MCHKDKHNHPYITKLESIETNQQKTQKGLKQNTKQIRQEIKQKTRQIRQEIRHETRQVRREISIMQRRCSICIALITFVLITSLTWLYVLTDMHTSLEGIVSNLNLRLLSFGSTTSTTKHVSDEIDKMKSFLDEKEKESKIENKELRDDINNLTDNVAKNHNDLEQLKEEINKIVRNVKNSQDKSDVRNKLNECLRIEFNKIKEKNEHKTCFFVTLIKSKRKSERYLCRKSIVLFCIFVCENANLTMFFDFFVIVFFQFFYCCCF